MAPSVAPPTPQEIQRKLSVHSASRIKPPTTSAFGGPSPSNISNTLAPGTSGISTSWGTAGLISGTESDSDSILTPDIASSHAAFNLPSTSIMQPPLSSIAERSPGSGGEDSDEEDDEGAGWRVVTEGAKVGGPMSGVSGGQTRAADVVLKSGYLSKKGERRKTWKKRWFVLRPTHLAFYKTDAEYKLLRLLDLNDVHSCVPVSLKRHSNVLGLILPKRTYYLQAASAQDAQDWVEAIEDARQTLMATSTQNSGNNGSVSTPIPIPQASTTDTNLISHPLPISISPHQQNPNTAQLISSSDSEDAISQLAVPPPIGGPPPPSGGGGGGGGTERGGGVVAPSPTNVTFAPIASKPPLPASPPPKDVSASASKIILSGYLMKCGSKRRNWRKRWFVLTAEKLVYSRSHMDTKPHRIFAFTDILDAMDYDLPKHRSHHYHHHHTTTNLTPSLSASSPPSTGEGALGTSVGTVSSFTASQTSTSAAVGGNTHADLGTETQQGGRNFTFKIVTTKRNLLLCAPSEEDEIKWLGAVRALIARRTASGPASALQQQQGLSSSTPTGEGTGGSGTAGTGAGGGIKSKVRRLSASAGVLGVGGGKSSTTTTASVATVGGGAPTTTTMSTAIGAAGAAGDETRDTH